MAGTLTDPIELRRARESAEIRRARAGDRDARERLVRDRLPLARALARRYARPGRDLDDLEQVASIALLKAVERFDPERGTLLSTYATTLILGELKRWLRDTGWGLRVPRGTKDLAVRINRAVPDLTAVLGRSPTIAEIAAAVASDPEAVLEALDARSATAVRSLAALDGDSDDGHDGLGADDPGFERAEQRAVIRTELRRLSDRERTALSLRFSSGLSQAEIAARLGVSQTQVSRLLRNALARAAHAGAG
jgi:RNA polymerase sigma-B factor